MGIRSCASPRRNSGWPWDAAGALVYEVTPGGDIVAHGLERVTGYRADEVALTLDWWYSLVHPDDLPAHRDRIARFGRRLAPANATYRIRRKDGAWIWVEGTAQTFKDPSGAVTKRVGAAYGHHRNAKEAMDALRESEQRLRDVARRLKQPSAGGPT